MIHPGRPSPDPDNTYAPMAIRPSELECGSPVHFGHLDPPCCLVGWMLFESRMDNNEYLHTRPIPGQKSAPVPLWTEPLPPPAILNAEGRHEPSPAKSPKVMATDSGPLGGPPWSGKMHYRMDIEYKLGEMVQRDDRERIFDSCVAGVRRYCSGHHSSWPEHRGRPICWELVRQVTHGRQNIDNAAAAVGVTPERATWLLHRLEGKSWQGSVDKLWTWVANDVNGIIGLRKRVDDPAA